MLYYTQASIMFIHKRIKNDKAMLFYVTAADTAVSINYGTE